MAKLQQMNETSKQNSQILLNNGYVTMNGKRYYDCTPAEKEAFNNALRLSIKKAFAPKRGENEKYIPKGEITNCILDCLLKNAVRDEICTSSEFGFTSTHGIYKLDIGGGKNEHNKTVIVSNKSFVCVNGVCTPLRFTPKQEALIIKHLEKIRLDLVRLEHEARVEALREEELINPTIFEQLKSALRPENDNDHEGWWHLKSTCGCYTMRLSGCYNKGILNAEAEVYKSVGKHSVYYDLTNAQWLDVQESLEAEYERLVEDSEESERNNYYKELSHDWHQFI